MVAIHEYHLRHDANVQQTARNENINSKKIDVKENGENTNEVGSINLDCLQVPHRPLRQRKCINDRRRIQQYGLIRHWSLLWRCQQQYGGLHHVDRHHLNPHYCVPQLEDLPKKIIFLKGLGETVRLERAFGASTR